MHRHTYREMRKKTERAKVYRIHRLKTDQLLNILLVTEGLSADLIQKILEHVQAFLDGQDKKRKTSTDA